MRVLVVYTNTYRMLAPAPVGASLVASRLRQDGHDVRFLDLMFARAPAAAAARAAADFRPDLVAYSLRNVDNQAPDDFFDPLPTLRAVVGAVRAAWPAPTLLGGTAFTTFPRRYLDELGADYGIAGDDLEPISRFVASLAAGRPDVTLPGVVHRADGAVTCNPFAIRGYAETRFDGWDLVDLRPYRRSLWAFWEAGLCVRTGCPFQCVFCDTYRTFGRSWVLRDPALVVEEAKRLERHGARSVFFADAGFNRPLDHAKQVLEALIRAEVRLGLTCVFEPGEGDAEFARLFRRAGGRAAMLFATSLAGAVLERSRKPFQVEDVLTGAGFLRAADVPYFLYLTFGGPGETPATVAETVRAAAQLRPSFTLVGRGFRIEPETELRTIAVAEGAIAADDDCFQPTFYHSPATPPDYLAAQVKRYEAAHRWDQVRTLPWMARLLWDKHHP